jgi:low temperature requirement protein LtrA
MAARRTGLLRVRAGHDEARVETAELFFDLVFVFAITQLSHRLTHHPTVHGALETAILFVAIWWTWVYTAWATNWLDPARTRVRFLIFALMAGGLVVSMSIPEAFAEKALPFALAFVGIEIVRGLFTAAAFRGNDRAIYMNFVRTLVWQALCAAFWIGGALIEDKRFALWAAAIALWSIAPALSYRVPGLGRSRAAEWTVEAHHLAERCGLFIIIALGESVLATGETFAEIEWTRPAILAFLASFVGTIALWWCYFNIGAARAAHIFAASREPGRVARLAYTYLHIPIVGGIIVAAAAIQLVIAAPAGPMTMPALAMTTAGPILFLAGTAAFKRAAGARTWPLSHLVGLAALIVLGVAGRGLAAYWFSLAVAAVLTAVAVWETLSLRPHRNNSEGLPA